MAKRKISDKEYLDERNKNPDALNYPEVLQQGLVIDIQHTDWVVVKNKFPYIEFDGRKVVSHFLLVSKDNTIESFTDIDEQDMLDIQENIKEMKKQVENLGTLIVKWKESNQEMRKFHIHLIVV